MINCWPRRLFTCPDEVNRQPCGCEDMACMSNAGTWYLWLGRIWHRRPTGIVMRRNW